MADLGETHLSSSPETKNVLIVDDDPRTREEVSRTLTLAGYTVTTAAHGDDCARPLDARIHDAIRASMNWDPATTAGQVRALKRRARSTPLVLLCAADRVQLAVECRGRARTTT